MASQVASTEASTPSGAESLSSSQCFKLQNLCGSVVALITPMKEDEENSVDYEALKKLVYWHYESGTRGIVVMGTTGENPTVTDAEYSKIVSSVVEFSRDASDGKMPVIAGTGTNSTRTTIEKTRLAVSLGVDAVLVVTPYYNKPTQEGLVQHYSLVARSCPTVPIILYNVPSRTGCDLLPETVARLAQLPTIIGTKEASGKFERYAELGKLCEPNFKIFSGEDDQVVPAILSGSGVVGVISVSANVLPNLVQAACQLALDKKNEEAVALQERLLPLHKILFIEPNPCPAKFILTSTGRIPGGVRMPLMQISEENQAAVSSVYKTASSV